MNRNILKTTTCNLCGADDTKLLMRINGLNIVKCKRCGLLYVNPRYEGEKLYQIYTKDYFQNTNFKNLSMNSDFYGYEDYLADEENIKATFNCRFKQIEQFTNKGKLLDIGCATGFSLEVAQAKGWDAIGIEISDYAVQYAQKKGLNVYLGKLKERNFPSNIFNAVTIWDVVEHVENPFQELQEIHRILMPGGILSLSTPCVGSFITKLLGNRWEEFRRVREHTYFFSKETIVLMLQKVGFEILKLCSANKFFWIGDAVRRAKFYIPCSDLLLSGVYGLILKIGLERIRVNINSFTKIMVYARKKSNKKWRYL